MCFVWTVLARHGGLIDPLIECFRMVKQAKGKHRVWEGEFVNEKNCSSSSRHDGL